MPEALRQETAVQFIHDPDGSRLPIKFDSTRNGEYAPIP
jgi:hypothetical protein